MTITTKTSRLLSAMGTVLFCSVPLIFHTTPVQAMSDGVTVNADTSSGIASWYQARQRGLHNQNSNLGSLQSRADVGDSDAQYQLGLIYQSGRGVERNIALAQQLFERAAQSGNAYAQYALALLLREQGGGGQSALQRSVQLQEQAAANGHPEAQYGLGLLYANGQYVPHDIYKARHWLQQANSRGNVMAELALRDLPAQGAAGPKVQPEQRYQAPPSARPVAHQPLRPANPVVTEPVEPVNLVSPVNPARPLQRPQPPVVYVPRQRPAQAAPPLTEPETVVMNAPAVNSDLTALPVGERDAQAGVAVEHNQSSVNLDGMSVAQIRSAAQRGDRYAQLMLGALYEDGSDGVQQSYETALSWYLKSARQGYPKAQHNLALLYEDGRGTRKSYRQAAIWYEKAAQAGFSEAQNNLAVLYILGKGVEADRDHAEKLLREAVAAGNPNARRNLSMLMDGEG